MKQILFSILFVTTIVTGASAHTDDASVVSSKRVSTSFVVEVLFHGLVLGGLVVAGVNGLVQNKKSTGKYIVL
jgi:hypothetical protein